MNAPSGEHAVPSILLIEDDDVIATILSYNLESAGFRVDRISDGREALDQIRKKPPDLLVLDWTLPGLSGIELLKQLRRFSESRRLPVVMVTGRTEAADRTRAQTIGADLFLTKPFSIKEFMTAVCGLIGLTAANGTTG